MIRNNLCNWFLKAQHTMICVHLGLCTNEPFSINHIQLWKAFLSSLSPFPFPLFFFFFFGQLGGHVPPVPPPLDPRLYSTGSVRLRDNSSTYQLVQLNLYSKLLVKSSKRTLYRKSIKYIVLLFIMHYLMIFRLCIVLFR